MTTTHLQLLALAFVAAPAAANAPSPTLSNPPAAVATTSAAPACLAPGTAARSADAAAATAASAAPRPAPMDSVYGRVTDAGGSGIAGVDVTMPDLGRGTRTGADGRFALANVPDGVRTLVFRRTGYSPATRTVQVPPGGPVDVSLSESPFQLEPVTVTATRSALSVGSSALPTSALDRAALRQVPTISIAHSLANIAGVRTLSTGQEMGKPVIHGLTGSRVLVLDNGQRLQDYSWSSEDGPSIDARMADRVEVVRGPASVLYGADAIGGVVNVVPAPLPDALGREPFRRVGLETYGASNNRELGGVLRVEGATGGFGYRVVGIGRKSEALHTPNGELDNTGYFALNGSAAAGLRGDWGNFEARVERYGGEFKLLEATPTPQQSPVAGGDQGPVRKLNDIRTQLNGNFIFDPDFRLETKAQWQRHELAEVAEGDQGGTPPPGGEQEGLELLLNTLSVDALLHHAPQSLPLHGTLGVSGSYQMSDTRGIVPLIPSASTWNAAAFAFESFTAGRLTLQGGVRGDVTQVSSDGNVDLNEPALKEGFNAATANLGLVYELSSAFSVAINGGRAWRAPNLFELFANGPELGEDRYVIGDANMSAEASWQGDVGLRLHTGVAHGEVDGYVNRMSNFVFLSPTGEFRDSMRVYRYTQAKATLRGVDASLEVEAARPLTLSARYGYVWGNNDSTDSPLPLIPPQRLDLGARLHSRSIGWAENAYVGGDVEMVAHQSRLSTFDYPTAGYSLLNLEAGFERDLNGSPLHVGLSIRNALNRAYKSYLSRYKEFALNPGRDITVRVSLGM